MSGIALISSRDRRTLALGGLVIGTIVMMSCGLPIWREWDARTRTDAHELSAELSILERDLSRLTALGDSARVRSGRADALRDRLIEGETVSAAGAALATTVTDLADDLGIKVSAVQIRPDSVFRANHARVAVRLTASGDVIHLTDLLTALETGTLLLAVRELSISPSDAFAPDAQPEVLRFQLLVEGLAVRHPKPVAAR